MTAIRHITIDCADTYALGNFWAAVLGHPLADDDFPGDPEALLHLPEGPDLLFIQVPEGKAAKNRLHFDIAPDTTRDEEVERLLTLGATVYEDHRMPDGRGWVTMRDIEGNEFCVERSEAERASWTPPAA
ncbi:glyoxalase [Actinorhabdospora filicis]|uniref:Glyoxalase n=1 Tax=Actinorhabdospora filicis TaxID=1785913 RepID=A0A9W6SQP7_9ACTN|nr:VOC family protein [Actinorhabdospora filicis]GLZ80117.1 glyoxalase [Actinorhabdospora filicis]